VKKQARGSGKGVIWCRPRGGGGVGKGGSTRLIVVQSILQAECDWEIGPVLYKARHGKEDRGVFLLGNDWGLSIETKVEAGKRRVYDRENSLDRRIGRERDS